MRNILIIFLLMTFSTISAEDSLSIEKAKQIIFCEDRTSTSFRQHGMTPIQIEQIVGAKITKKFSVLFSYSAMIGLYHKNDIKTYYKNPLILGGGVDYNLLRQYKENGFFDKGMSLDARILISSTIASANIKYTLYETGVYRYNNNKEISPTLGIGIRHINYHTPGLENSYSFFLSIGFRY